MRFRVRAEYIIAIVMAQSRLAFAGIKLTPEAKRLLEIFDQSGKISFTRLIRSFESSSQSNSVRRHAGTRAVPLF